MLDHWVVRVEARPVGIFSLAVVKLPKVFRMHFVLHFFLFALGKHLIEVGFHGGELDVVLAFASFV